MTIDTNQTAYWPYAGIGSRETPPHIQNIMGHEAPEVKL